MEGLGKAGTACPGTSRKGTTRHDMAGEVMKLRITQDWLTRQQLNEDDDPGLMVYACSPDYLRQHPNSLIAQMARIDTIDYMVRTLELVRDEKVRLKFKAEGYR